MSATQQALSQSTRFARLLPWLVFGMSSLFVTYQMLLQTAPSVMIPDLQDAFHIDTFGVSLLSSSFFYTYMIFQIPSGLLIDRVEPRRCLTFCLIGVAIVTALFAYSHTLGEARFARILQGIFSAPSVVPAMYLAAMWFPANRFALLAGMTEMIGMSGAALGQATLAPSVAILGWRSTLFACAIIGIVMAVFTWMIVRNKPQQQNIETKSCPKKSTSVLQDIKAVVAHPEAWVNGVCCGLLFAIPAAFGAFWCIPYLQAIYPIDLSTAALASSMVLFGSALGAPTLGWISDRSGRRRLPMLVSTAIVLVLMLSILYIPDIHLSLMFVLLACVGFFSSAYVIPFAAMRDLVPQHVRGTAMGYTNLMCIFIGAPLLQPLIGWVYDKQLAISHNDALAYTQALGLVPLCIGLALFLTLFVRDRRSHHFK